MRVLRYVAFLLIVGATVAVAAEPGRANSSMRGALTRDANGNFQFSVMQAAPSRKFIVPTVDLADASDPRKQLAQNGADEALRETIEGPNVCYFIRSYIMKREGERGATHLERVETCTPMSRIHT
ncbi:MAG: hypothetical protein ACRD3E_20305, partial [Terriglobales bacterium]